jgi:lipoprotein LprG
LKRILCLLLVLIFICSSIGCNGVNSILRKSGTSPSFAIITDLHIGYGIPDYYPDYPVKVGFGWLDKAEGYPGDNDLNKFCAEKLEAAVETIIKEREKYNIQFVVVLGDISDTAERSELQEAQRILGKLNDYGIPFIPTDGNHDMWSYTQPADNFHPEDRSIVKDVADATVGDRLFEEVFWGEGDSKNIELINKLFGDSWQRIENPVELPNVPIESYLENYGFSFEDVTFLYVDINPRARIDWNPILDNGFNPYFSADLFENSAYPGSPRGFLPTYHQQTVDFAKNYTANHISEAKTVVIFSHYRIYADALDVLISNIQSNDQIYSFFGHEHGTNENEQFLKYNSKASKFYGVLTEDLAGIDLPLTGTRQNKPIRIVQIKDGNIDYSTLLPRELIPSEIIAQCRAAMLPVNSFHFELNHEGGVTPITDWFGIKKISGDAVLPDKFQAKVTATLNSFSLVGKDSNMIMIGDKAYLDYSGKWEVYEDSKFNSIRPMEFVSELLDGLTGLEKLDEQAIDGLLCYHLKGEISSDKLESLTGSAIKDKSVAVDILINKLDFRICQVKIQGKITEAEKEGITRTLIISNYNQPVSINAPQIP